MVDYAALIGAPFEYGGRGPEKFDCYGLVMHIFKQNHDCEIPDFRSSIDQAINTAKFSIGLQNWRVVPREPGTAVLFRIGKYISHCGYMIDDLQMIHTWQDSGGVVIERLRAWQQRTVGFYRYVGHH